MCLLLMCFIGSCTDKVIYDYDFDTAEFELLENAIQKQSADELIALTASDNKDISKLAWNSLAKVEVSELRSFYEYVKSVNNSNAWFAITYQYLDNDLISEISKSWAAGEINRDAACKVFSRFGNRSTIEMIINEITDFDQYKTCALAIGRISANRSIDSDLRKSILEAAFDVQIDETRYKLLYGFYRSRLNSIRQRAVLSDYLLTNWKEIGLGNDPFLDQMIVKIVGERALDEFTTYWFQQQAQVTPAMLIEYISVISELQLFDLHTSIYKNLLKFDNHSVQLLTINHLKNHPSVSEELLIFIEEEITKKTRNSTLFVNTLEVLVKNNISIENYRYRLAHFDKENPYLFRSVAGLKERLLPDNDFNDLLFERAYSGGVDGSIAFQAISQKIRRGDYDEDYLGKFKELLEFILDNGYSYASEQLTRILLDDQIISVEEVELFFDKVLNLDPHLNRQFYELFSEVIIRRDVNFDENHAHFEEVAKHGLVRLNDTLRRLGYRFDDIDLSKTFEPVDWTRLSELGEKPHWKIVTNKGTIVIRLDPLNAPFTVSSIDNLTSSGKYNGISFHRVVPGFVAQGGDFINKNGSGSPNYFLPTESAPGTFKRGIVGMASGGLHSEGSQFFITKKWSPHLDGLYTNFGEVFRGMDVAEKLEIGDYIIRAEIKPM